MRAFRSILDSRNSASIRGVIGQIKFMIHGYKGEIVEK